MAAGVWSEELCERLEVPLSLLPEVRESGSPLGLLTREAATALGTSFNNFGDNPVIMSDLFADLPAGSNSSIQLSWTTNVPSRTQVWWKRYNETSGHSNTLDLTLSTTHSDTITGLWAKTEYLVMPTSTADGYGDAGGRRFRVKVGDWDSRVCQLPSRERALSRAP